MYTREGGDCFGVRTTYGVRTKQYERDGSDGRVTDGRREMYDFSFRRNENKTHRVRRKYYYNTEQMYYIKFLLLRLLTVRASASYFRRRHRTRRNSVYRHGFGRGATRATGKKRPRRDDDGRRRAVAANTTVAGVYKVSGGDLRRRRLRSAERSLHGRSESGRPVVQKG